MEITARLMFVVEERRSWAWEVKPGGGRWPRPCTCNVTLHPRGTLC